MANKVFSRIVPLALAAIVLASCGNGADPKSSSKVSSESSAAEKTPWELYARAKDLTAVADPFGFRVAGAMGSMAFETGKEEEEEWSTTTINVDYLDMVGAFSKLGKGNSSSEGYLSITDSKLLITSDQIPEEYSRLIEKTGIHIDGSLYLDNGRLYVDASNVYLQLIATAIGTGLSASTGDDWEFPARGYHDLTSDEFLLLSTVDSLRKKSGDSDLLVSAHDAAIVLGKEDEVFTVSVDKFENNVIKMEIEDEGLLKTVLMDEFDVIYDSLVEAQEEVESSTDVEIKDRETAKADFEDTLDDLLDAIEFDHYAKTVVFNDTNGIVSEERDFKINSFDHDSMLAIEKESGDILKDIFEEMMEESSEESSEEPVDPEEPTSYVLPTGEWSAKAKFTYQYRDDVKIEKLSDLQKTRYEEITFPEKESE